MVRVSEGVVGVDIPSYVSHIDILDVRGVRGVDLSPAEVLFDTRTCSRTHTLIAGDKRRNSVQETSKHSELHIRYRTIVSSKTFHQSVCECELCMAMPERV